MNPIPQIPFPQTPKPSYLKPLQPSPPHPFFKKKKQQHPRISLPRIPLPSFPLQTSFHSSHPSHSQKPKTHQPLSKSPPNPQIKNHDIHLQTNHHKRWIFPFWILILIFLCWRGMRRDRIWDEESFQRGGDRTTNEISQKNPQKTQVFLRRRPRIRYSLLRYIAEIVFFFWMMAST